MQCFATFDRRGCAREDRGLFVREGGCRSGKKDQNRDVQKTSMKMHNVTPKWNDIYFPRKTGAIMTGMG